MAVYRQFLDARGKPSAPSDVAPAVNTDRVFRIPAIKLLEAQKQHNDAIYSYLFDWESPLMNGAMGACHAVELGFVFGTYDKNGAQGFFGEGPAADELSELTRTAWTNFARSGDPGNQEWRAYDTTNRVTMVLGQSSQARDAPWVKSGRSGWKLLKLVWCLC